MAFKLDRCRPPNLAEAIMIDTPPRASQLLDANPGRWSGTTPSASTSTTAAGQRSMMLRQRPLWTRRLAAPLMVALSTLSTVTAAGAAAPEVAYGRSDAGPTLPDKELYRVVDLPGVPMEEWGLAPMYAGYMPVETAAAAKGSDGASVRPPIVRIHSDLTGLPRTRIYVQGPPPLIAAASRRAAISFFGSTNRRRPPRTH